MRAELELARETPDLAESSFPKGVRGNPYAAALDQLSGSDLNGRQDRFVALINRFGFGCLSESSIASIGANVGSNLVSIFAGAGYAEAQLEAAGFDIVAFDKTPPKKCWFLNVRKGSASMAARYPKRALFMSFPEKLGDRHGSFAYQAARQYAAKGGKSLVLISLEDPTHPFGCAEDLHSFMQRHLQVAKVSLPKWPQVFLPWSRNPEHSKVEPLLSIFALQKKKLEK